MPTVTVTPYKPEFLVGDIVEEVTNPHWRFQLVEVSEHRVMGVALSTPTGYLKLIYQTLELDPLYLRRMTTLDQRHSECSHSWKNYVGLTEIYEYCEHCDAKRK